MLISQKGHNHTIQVYSVTVITHVKALQAGQSSQEDLSLLHRSNEHWDMHVHLRMCCDGSIMVDESVKAD